MQADIGTQEYWNATAFAAAELRSLIATSAPSRASRRAVSAPRPEPPPVMNATLS